MSLPRALIESTTGERLFSESKSTPNGKKLVVHFVVEVVTSKNGPA
jgi:hypothetical protein